MPQTYTVTDPTTGRQVKLTGDSPPTEAELTEIFSHLNSSAPADRRQSAIAEIDTANAAKTDAASRGITGVLTGSGISAIPGFVGTALTQNPVKTVADVVKNTVAPLGRLGNVGDAFRRAGLTGAANEVAASIPILGPAAEHASQQSKAGNQAGAVGEMFGMAASPFLGDAVIAKAGEVLPAVKAALAARREAAPIAEQGRLTSDLLKAVPASPTAAYRPADVARAAPYLKNLHEESAINSVQGLVTALDSGITQIEEHVNGYLGQYGTDLIRTNPLMAARRALAQSVKAGDVEKGLKSLDGYGLDQPMTLTRADAVRLRMNAENESVLAKNQYDRATARKTDPEFAAREAVAESLRDGIYGQLEQRGIAGVRDLRLDEGSLIRIRNAAQRQTFRGDKSVPGSGQNTVAGKITRAALPAAGGGIGAMMAGPYGAIPGVVMGETVARRFAPSNLTHDALVERAFTNLRSTRGASFAGVPPREMPMALLPSHPQALPGGPDTSFVRGVPAMAQPPNAMRMLPAHESGIPLPPAPDQSGVTTIPARGIVVRDPKTGRFKRVFTTEGAQ